LRALANTALFLIACAAGCAVLGWLAPFPAVPGIFPKWEWFKKQRDQFEVLFIGSSRFFHQVIPQQFDEEVAQAGGAKVRSFNFGYDGAWPPESFYLLRQILTLQPARLKWVVIELKDIDFHLDENNRSTLRTAYWHDARHTKLACDDILAAHISEPDRRALLMGHLRLFLQHATNMGRGAELVSKRLAPSPPRKKPYTWEPHAGYDAELTRTFPDDSLPRLLADSERMKKLPAPVPVRPVFHDALRAIIADVRRAGAEPIFVIAPTINPEENYGGIPDGAPVWSFNNPAEFPALYEPANRYDLWHLNHQGAIHFTTLLAARFADFTRKSP
jgi:hypothetical protein